MPRDGARMLQQTLAQWRAVTSIILDGALWGLIACHHYSPRAVGYEMRFRPARAGGRPVSAWVVYQFSFTT